MCKRFLDLAAPKPCIKAPSFNLWLKMLKIANKGAAENAGRSISSVAHGPGVLQFPAQTPKYSLHRMQRNEFVSELWPPFLIIRHDAALMNTSWRIVISKGHFSSNVFYFDGNRNWKDLLRNKFSKRWFAAPLGSRIVNDSYRKVFHNINNAGFNDMIIKDYYYNNNYCILTFIVRYDFKNRTWSDTQRTI